MSFVAAVIAALVLLAPARAGDTSAGPSARPGPAAIATSGGRTQLFLRHWCGRGTVTNVGTGRAARQVVCSPSGITPPLHVLPLVSARAGEVATIALPFKPTKVTLVLLRENQRVASFTFRPRRTVAWRIPAGLSVSSEGVQLVLSASSSPIEGATYIGRLVLADAVPAAPVLVTEAGERAMQMASMTITFANGVGHADGGITGPLSPATLRAGEEARIRLDVDPISVELRLFPGPAVALAPAREVTFRVPGEAATAMLLAVTWRDDNPSRPAIVEASYYLPVAVAPPG